MAKELSPHNNKNHAATPKQHVTKETPTIVDERVMELKNLFPEIVAEGKIDFEKLRLALGDDVDSQAERYNFTWSGKRDAIRMLQTPSRATLIPCKEESVNFDTSQNIFIEGENLEVLKLLYKPYFGRIKMIYIDPPYNTGNDFVYPDNFADPLDTYLRLTGQKDAEGNLLTSNPETSGRYHSSWLSMMYPRLFLARQLLRDDGVIFVSIDDHEVYNLRMLMNEVFGEENFRNAIFVSRVKKNIQEREAVRTLNQGVDYILCYSKSADALIVPAKKLQKKEERWHAFDAPGVRPTMEYELFRQKPPVGRHWMYEKERALSMIDSGDLRLSPKTGKLQYRLAASDETNLDTNWTDLIESDSTWIKNGGKNPNLIWRLLQVINDKSAIVLDFFAGSCTTAQAVLELNREDGGNRRFIMMQLPEPTGNAEFPTIAAIGKERIRRVIAKMKKGEEDKLDLSTRDKPEDMGFKVFKLTTSNYRPWIGIDKKDQEGYAKTIELFADPLVDGWKPENVIYEAAIKEGYGLNCQIEPVQGIEGNTVCRVTDPDKEQSFYICLDDHLDLSALKALSLTREDMLICRDTALDDSAAVNLALQCRLKTI